MTVIRFRIADDSDERRTRHRGLCGANGVRAEGLVGGIGNAGFALELLLVIAGLRLADPDLLWPFPADCHACIAIARK